MTKSNKFGTQTFFVNYISGQFEKESGANRQEVIHRIHFSMSTFILEEFTGKQAITYLRNLNVACEEVSSKITKRADFFV